MKMMNLKKKIIIALVTACFIVPQCSFAAENTDIDTMISNQQQVLQQLNEKKVKAQSDALTNRITEMESQMQNLKALGSYDSKSAINSLSDQINDLRQQLAAQTDAQNKIFDKLKDIEQKQTIAAQTISAGSDTDNEGYHAYGNTSKFLVNPAPDASAEVSYTQDAINAQGNSTMVFKYASNQLYKIYCRTGYLTDLEFKKGEKLTFAGGGDTAGWSVNSTDVDGTPHLYIKPVVQSSTTNLIVTTTHHSYQIILNSSDWYNPMVRWTYENEEHMENLIAQQKNAKTVTGTLNVSNPESLDFDYEISGDSNSKPTMAFDDGEKTFIKFKNLPAKMPVLFVKEKGKKALSLVNFSIKDNYYIVDKVFSEAQLRISDKEIITIKRK